MRLATATPHNFPPYQMIYGYCRRWTKDGTWERIHDTLRAQVRRKPGVINILLRAVWIAKALKPLPWPVSKGTDAAKCIQGRKRHILVDTMGLLLVVVVTAANVPEREGGEINPGVTDGQL